MTHRITVIIPTRNRCETLGPTLKTCLTQDNADLRIIVSDNSSDDCTREVVTACSDRRLQYLNTGRRLSMTGNFEFSLSHVQDGYVCFLGDDDGLMPRAIDSVTGIARETDADAITSSSVYYAWPNFPLESLRNVALLRDIKSNTEWRCAKDEVAQLVSYRGREREYVWGLPGLYRGFVKADVVKRARCAGRYFHSVTPDAYSAFVNSFFIDRYIYMHAPLTIEGVSGKSNGASQIFGTDAREENAYLSENDIPTYPDLVYAPSPAIVLAEAYLQARARFPEHCANHDFSIARVCAAALRDNFRGPNRERVAAAVAEIRQRHGIGAESGRTFLAALADVVSRLRKSLRTIEVQCSRFRVADVYGASVVADHLLILQRGGATTQGIERIWDKLKTRLRRS